MGIIARLLESNVYVLRLVLMCRFGSVRFVVVGFTRVCRVGVWNNPFSVKTARNGKKPAFAFFAKTAAEPKPGLPGLTIGNPSP